MLTTAVSCQHLHDSTPMTSSHAHQSITRQQSPTPCDQRCPWSPARLQTHVSSKFPVFFAVTLAIDHTYTEIAHQQHNIFLFPSGKVGRDFVRELSRFFTANAERKLSERIAMKAAMTMPGLLLLKPDIKSEAKDYVK